jgi:hypothetical protein
VEAIILDAIFLDIIKKKKTLLDVGLDQGKYIIIKELFANLI